MQLIHTSITVSLLLSNNEEKNCTVRNYVLGIIDLGNSNAFISGWGKISNNGKENEEKEGVEEEEQMEEGVKEKELKEKFQC